jgi:SAM-dependent methyltransferase
MTANKIYDVQDINSDEARSIINSLGLNPLYRKSWEHVQQYTNLNKLGLVSETSKGISFGAGRESMMYYMSHIVREMWATDLYYSDTRWVGDANTDNPEGFVKSNPPLSYDENSLKAMYMDMRDASFFENDYFDFAYSSCSISHIGNYDDFLSHLQEARRILRPGGAYVVTTEISVNEKLVVNPGMYFFNSDYLANLIHKSGFNTDHSIDFYQSDSMANYPLPLNAELIFGESFIKSYVNAMENEYGTSFMTPRTQIYADIIYAGLSLVLRKEEQTFDKFTISNKDNFDNLLNSKFVPYVQNALSTVLTPDPCGHLSNQKCPLLLSGFKNSNESEEGDALDGFVKDFLDVSHFHEHFMHTVYMPLGNNEKHIEVKIKFAHNIYDNITISVYGFCHEDTSNFYRITEEKVPISGDNSELSLYVTPKECEGYAVLGDFEYQEHLIKELDINIYDSE